MNKRDSVSHLGDTSKLYPPGFAKIYKNFGTIFNILIPVFKGTTIKEEELESTKYAEECKSLLERINPNRPNKLQPTVQLCVDYSQKFKKV